MPRSSRILVTAIATMAACAAASVHTDVADAAEGGAVRAGRARRRVLTLPRPEAARDRQGGEVWIPPLPTMESVAPPPGWVTSGPDVPPMPLTLLRLPRTNITRAKFPAIDFHVHAPQLTTAAAYQGLITLLDSIGMGAIVNLNGGTGTTLDAALKAGEPCRDRIATFLTFNPTGSTSRAGREIRRRDGTRLQGRRPWHEGLQVAGSEHQEYRRQLHPVRRSASRSDLGDGRDAATRS